MTSAEAELPVRRALSQRGILEEALALIDAEGLAALTMNRLGERLGVRGMTLYHYLPSRDAVIDGVVELVVDELYGDPDVHLSATEGWPDYLGRLANGVRRFALAHPRAFPVVATRPPSAPWVRPPLRSLRWIESFLQTFRSAGFSDDATLYTYRAFTSFLLGHLLLETGAMTAEHPVAGDGSFTATHEVVTEADAGELDTDPATPVAGEVAPASATPAQPRGDPSAGLDPALYPIITEFADRLSDSHAEQEFADSLSGLIERISELAPRLNRLSRTRTETG